MTAEMSHAEPPIPSEEPPSDRVAATRAAILDAVQEAVDTVGVRSFRLDDIAARAGVTRQTVANHFGTKDDLLRAFLHDRNAGFTTFLFQLLQTSGDLESTLRIGVAFLIEFLTTRPSLQPPLRADFVAYVTTKATDYPDEQARMVAESLAEHTDADPRACLLAGQVLFRLIYSYVTQPTEETSRDEQIDLIVRCTLLALGR